MHASYFVRACAGAAVTFVVGCSAPSAEPEVALSSDALTALSSSEIVGDLTYGQTSAPVAYTESPKYRAFRFQGRAGDAVDAWVRSTSGDARAWLLDASFRNVTSNDNATTSTLDSHLVATLTKDGAYYIAFREVTLEDASFTVSLASTTTSSGCDPEESNCDGAGPVTSRSVWDDAWTQSPLATQAELRAHFTPGASRAELGASQVGMRYRRCNVQTGCPGWTNTEKVSFWAKDYPRHEEVSPKAPMVLQTSASSGISLGCDSYFVFPGNSTMYVMGWVKCAAGAVQLVSVQSPYYDGYGLPTGSADIAPAVYRTYAYGKSQVYVSQTDTNGTYMQAQYAFFVKLDASAPTPLFDR